MSTADLVTLRMLEQKVGRSFEYELDEHHRCIGIDLTCDTALYQGLIRHHSGDEKQEILRLVCRLSALRRLNLRRNKVGRLPPAFRDLQELEWLNLGSNCLGHVPDELQHCTKLRYLHLGNNGLTEIPGFIGKFQQLEYLTLHKNVGIKSIGALESAKNLRHLNLHYLNLHRLPEFVYRWKQLVTLTLWNIREFSPELGSLQQLEFFSNCGCVGLHKLPEEFTRLKNLRMVRLFQNSLEKLPESFGDLINLEQLSLYQNQLHELPASFERLTKLTRLNLGCNRFKFIPDCLHHCHSLQWLGIFGNPLKHTGKSEVAPHTVVQRSWPFTTQQQIT